MNKNLLLNSLNKIYLNLTGVDQYFIFLDIIDKSLRLKSYNVAHKSTVISEVIIDNFDMADCKLVIREPDKLIKILNIVKDDIKLNILEKYSIVLNINDGKINTDFILTDPKVLPKSILEQYEVSVEEPSQYDLYIPITNELHENLSKLKKAISTEILSVYSADDKVYFKLGDLNDYSTKSTFDLDKSKIINDVEEICFSSDTILSILDKNKTCEGVIYVYGEGLIKIEYVNKVDEANQNCVYYMFALDQI